MPLNNQTLLNKGRLNFVSTTPTTHPRQSPNSPIVLPHPAVLQTGKGRIVDPGGKVKERMLLGRHIGSKELFLGFKVFASLPKSNPIALSVLQLSAVVTLSFDPHNKSDFFQLPYSPVILWDFWWD